MNDLKKHIKYAGGLKMSNTAKQLDTTQINPKLKTKADKILISMGLTAEQAVNIFFAKIIDSNSIPFELKKQKLNDEFILSELKKAEKEEADGAKWFDGFKTIEELGKNYG
jgi:addiction module RelB/DinJ family antitoxin